MRRDANGERTPYDDYLDFEAARFTGDDEFIAFLAEGEAPHGILRRLRARFEFTQRNVDERAGDHEATVSRAESGGRKRPKRSTLLDILAVYYLTTFQKSLVLMRFGYGPVHQCKWLFDRSARQNRQIERHA